MIISIRMRIIQLLIWLIFIPVFAQEATIYTLPTQIANEQLATIFTEQPHRRIVSLNGEWQLINPADNSKIGNVRLPFSFQGESRFVLENTIRLSRIENSEIFLSIGSIAGEAKIWWNDSLVLAQKGGFLPVYENLSRFKIKENNRLRIQIYKDDYRHSVLPGFLPVNQPRTDAGILDVVSLHILPKNHIKDVSTTVTIEDSILSLTGTIAMTKSIADSLNGKLLLRILQNSDVLYENSLATNGNSSVELPLISLPNFKAWSVNYPFPIFLEVAIDSNNVIIEKATIPVAARKAGFVNGNFQWNNQPMQLDGLNYFYQSKNGAQLYNYNLIRDDLIDIKQRGFNTIRTILTPYPEWFYSLCDSIGLVVFQDMPFMLWSMQSDQYDDHLELWQKVQNHMISLSQKYSSIGGLGIAYYANLQDPTQRQRLQIVSEGVKKLQHIPIYASTMLPGGELKGIIDFQIVDVLGRRYTAKNVEQTLNLLKEDPFFISAFTKAMTFRVDSTVIAKDLLLSQEMYRKLKSNELSLNDHSNFIQTYSDYYQQLPSLQNGHYENLYLNIAGLVDIQRNPRHLNELRRQQIFATASPVGLMREDQGASAYLYIILGLANIVMLLIIYRRYKIFRQSLTYSIKKPHGFFVSLQERLIIPYKQSMIILIAISLNGALIFSAIFYFYRNHLLADYILSLFFFTPWLKAQAISLFWQQGFCIIVLTILFIAFFYFLALIIKFVSLFGRNYILYNQALAMSIWAATPFLFLLPLGVIMYSLLVMMKNYWILFSVLIYFHVWFYFRWINGVRVLTDQLYGRTFIVLTILLFFVVCGLGYAYEQYYHVAQHFSLVKGLQAFWK